MRRSLLRGATSGAWLPQFGEFVPLPPNIIRVTSGSPVGSRFHAEAHHADVLGADFTYSAIVTGNWRRDDLEAHLQFRISDEGRYGVRVRAGVIECYRFMLEERPCNDDPELIAHCRKWTESDDPVEVPLRPTGSFDRALPAIRLTIVAEGSRLTLIWGTPTRELGRLAFEIPELGIGRFGVYAIADASTIDVAFSDISADTDPTAASNFALLYSTPGYELDGTKRALVRTINELDPSDYDDAGSTFTVTDRSGAELIPFRHFEAIGPPGTPARWRRTLGIQVLAADFTDLRTPGRYTLQARIATSTGTRELHSRPFDIAPRLVTERMLWPLSILNANARRAADDDFRRNWFVDAGRKAWSVGLDGAFVADRADDQNGAVLRRIFNCGNRPLFATNFRFTARITIVAGCDAQLQFRITGSDRWAVTLQAGEAGGCQHGGGPGAVRLHREGPGVPGEHHIDAVASHIMHDKPFKLGRAYDVEVCALDSRILVMLDGARVIDFPQADPVREGTFALKAWGSTVRFGHVKIWAPNVAVSHPAPGVWIPYDRQTDLSSQGFSVTVSDGLSVGLPFPSDNDIKFPWAAQQHGFHDCNSFIGEITSHSVFLSGLMEIWTTRAHAATPAQQEDLRRAILTAVLYLNELYEQGNRSGAFAHQEPGRAALAISNQILTTRFAVYGLSSFAEKGSAVDAKLTRNALRRAIEAWNWLDDNRGRDLVLDSVVTLRLARAAQREGMASAGWFELAKTTAADVLSEFAAPGSMAGRLRPTLRSIPWFEGVYEAFVRGPLVLSDAQREQVLSIAAQLTALASDAANGFCVIPQADDERDPPDLDLAQHNWNNLPDLPLVVKPIPQRSDGPPPTFPVGDWYLSEHFATAAADSVYIGRLAGDRALERLATGNLYWMLGLNPGLPTTKVAQDAPSPGPWSAASFVYNGPGPFARSMEGDRTRTTGAKGWLATWEGGASSRHRESWAFDPANTGFHSIVNGHVLREGQWHYWNHGKPGWVSAETFMLIDASFIKAALALEDWHGGTTLVRATPYNVTRPYFFDTTHLDRASTSGPFDDPDRTPAAQAFRMATDFAASKGFGGGRPTGHFIGERVGVLCYPLSGTTFVDIPLSEVAATRFPFTDINAATWAQLGRVAAEIAANRRVGAGFFTGHQRPGSRVCGWIGIDRSLIEIFDIDDATVAASDWRFDDINTAAWARAARLATDVCMRRGFAGGFFSGHQLPNKRQIVALRHV